MMPCAYSHNPADCTPLFFTRLLLLAFALATIGLGNALAQCPIVAPGQTWNVDGCTLTLSTSASVSGVSIGVNAPAELDLNSSVTLAASNTVWVGFSATGTMNISNGGVVNDAYGDFGGVSGVAGTATVSGSGSQWNNSSELNVGLNGQGTLTVSGGGLLSDAQGYIGANSGSTGSVTVTGLGSRWSNSSLFVGGDGSATLTISGGGTVAAGPTGFAAIFISGPPGTSASVTVIGAGSQLTTDGGIMIGGYGHDSLMVQSGGLVLGQAIFLDGAPTPAGLIVSGSGSTLDLSSAVDIGTLVGSGTATVTSGATLAAPTITVGTHGTLDAKGGTLVGTVVNHGTLDPLGTATINGAYTQGVDGTLILDVAGTGAGDFGKLDISGNGTFGGTIDFNFIDGFAPSKGDSFDFINVGGSADFSGATIDIAGLFPGFSYADSFQNGQFVLTALNDGVASSPTPEPGMLLLFGTALLGVAWKLHGRQRVNASEVSL